MAHDDTDTDTELDAEALRKEWGKRETKRIYEAQLARIGSRTELSKDEFRILARYMFGDFPQLRRKALLSGTITMGDGRVVRRVGHVNKERE